MPLILFALVAFASAALGNMFFEAYLLFWCATIVITVGATFVKALKKEVSTTLAYILTLGATANFAASTGFFTSWGMYWYALFMLAFAVYYTIPGVRISNKMTSLRDNTKTRI